MRPTARAGLPIRPTDRARVNPAPMMFPAVRRTDPRRAEAAWPTMFLAEDREPPMVPEFVPRRMRPALPMPLMLPVRGPMWIVRR